MKTINITFTDEEHKDIIKIKGKQSWHDFILCKAIVEDCNNKQQKGSANR